MISNVKSLLTTWLIKQLFFYFLYIYKIKLYSRLESRPLSLHTPQALILVEWPSISLLFCIILWKKKLKNQLKDLCCINSTNFFFLGRKKKKKKKNSTNLYYIFQSFNLWSLLLIIVFFIIRLRHQLVFDIRRLNSKSLIQR